MSQGGRVLGKNWSGSLVPDPWVQNGTSNHKRSEEHHNGLILPSYSPVPNPPYRKQLNKLLSRFPCMFYLYHISRVSLRIPPTFPPNQLGALLAMSQTSAGRRPLDKNGCSRMYIYIYIHYIVCISRASNHQSNTCFDAAPVLMLQTGDLFCNCKQTPRYPVVFGGR